MDHISSGILKKHLIQFGKLDKGTKIQILSDIDGTCFKIITNMYEYIKSR